jgi:putative ABC transport system permease protein
MKSQAASKLFMRLSFQNLVRKPGRTALLVLAVALGTGAIFASYIVARGIQASVDQGFSRMGADLIVVPQNAMVNITSALLTVQPTEERIESSVLESIRSMDAVEAAVPQTIFRVPIMSGMPECKANLIAFDPIRDFTVAPWMVQHLDRPMQTGDLIAGCRRSESIGDEVQPSNIAAPVYAKLGRSGVGPLDDSFFTTYESINRFVPSADLRRPSVILVKLKFGATAEQVKFAISRLPDVKVVTGARIVTSTRQTTTALLFGMIGFTAIMLLASLILVGLVFSAIISERRREIGLLRAIGMQRAGIIQILVSESAFATGIGGIGGLVLGGALLLAFQRSLVYFLETLHMEFLWPAPAEIAAAACICACVSVAVGILGAALPALKVSGEEPCLLIQGEAA